MAINIKDDETDRLARELADLTGEPITVAVREAVEARLEALRRRAHSGVAPDFTDIIARGRARTTLDNRSDEEILGFGDDGVPT